VSNRRPTMISASSKICASAKLVVVLQLNLCLAYTSHSFSLGRGFARGMGGLNGS
jgi:hypothetical protein